MRWAIRLSIALITLAGCIRPAQTAAPDHASSPLTPQPTTLPPRPLKLALVTNNSSTFWKVMNYGLHKYETKANVHIDIKMPENGTVSEQNQILENLIAENYEGVAVSVISPRDQTEILEKLASRTRLITFDSDAPNSSRLIYIGTDNFAAGKRMGAQIVKLLPSGGKIAVFVGILSAENASQRLKGIMAAIEGHQIEIIDRREDNTDRAKAVRNATDVLDAHPDINLLCGLWSYNGPAIANALQSSRKSGKVLAVCFDEEDDTLTAIENGTINSTLAQQPAAFGYLAAKWLHNLTADFDKTHRDIPANKSIDAGVQLIDKFNVAAFRKQFAEMRK